MELLKNDFFTRRLRPLLSPVKIMGSKNWVIETEPQGGSLCLELGERKTRQQQMCYHSHLLQLACLCFLFLPKTLAQSFNDSQQHWNLFNPNLDHYTRSVQQIQQGNLLRGIETGRAAARYHPNHRDAVVNLGGFYLNLFNKDDYAKPVSHVQALELFSIMKYAMSKWPKVYYILYIYVNFKIFVLTIR